MVAGCDLALWSIVWRSSRRLLAVRSAAYPQKILLASILESSFIYPQTAIFIILNLKINKSLE